MFLFIANPVYGTTAGFSRPRSRSIVCGRVWKSGVSSWIQAARFRCSKVEYELDSCSQSVTGNHLIQQIEKQSVILHPPRALPRIKVLIKDDQP